MRLDEIANRGRQPWLPCPSAEDLRVLHFHDVPLIGTFRADDDHFAFMCLQGPEVRTGLWGYTRLTEGDVRQLAEDSDAMSLGDLQDTIAEHFYGDHAVFAIAEDMLLRLWTCMLVDKHVSQAATSALLLMGRSSSGEDAQVVEDAQDELLSLA